ncbi:L-type lectin-domain containing receptor kinase IX.1-like [Mercurialis annua]|uniref:L-type lectin-domain containing receptor kinase IX.1-like n=1 Tax=Mercurialis annua TaxID=3986 RepID=UPI00215F95CC|nr:L-type lectin-domain containing receptor kinase IX.1-like [Mercurialis annua]
MVAGVGVMNGGIRGGLSSSILFEQSAHNRIKLLVVLKSNGFKGQFLRLMIGNLLEFESEEILSHLDKPLSCLMFGGLSAIEEGRAATSEVNDELEKFLMSLCGKHDDKEILCEVDTRLMPWNHLNCPQFLLFSNADALSFSISRFNPGATDIVYDGDALASNGAIELINLVDYTCRIGHATYAEHVPLWDPSTGTQTDFTTQFSFSIDTLSSDFYGHGIAFFLAPVSYQIIPNSNSAFLGMVNTTAKVALSEVPVVFVEFDTYVNKQWDPSVQHVGINNNSIYSSVYADWDAGSYSGKTGTVLITYKSTTKVLTVFWTYEENPVFPSNNSLSYEIDLMKILPPWIKIGFSAATGQYMERNTIRSWEFSSTLVATEPEPEPEPDPNQPHRKRSMLEVYWIVIVVITGFFCFAFGVFVTMNRRIIAEKLICYGKRSKYAGASVYTELEKGAFPKRFAYAVLAKATNSFASDNKLGHGASANVYRGALTDPCCIVAVKKVFAESDALFVNEVNVISSLRHRNLVQFLGWCLERGEFLLVYEYMQKGSLADHLFGNKKPLPWSSRYSIMLAVASALKYLHEDAEQTVLHRDIKPENILLRTDFTAKVGDFGIAKLVDTQLKPEITNAVGTPGYRDPEYERTGVASEHTDMYSFGIVALEIASGKRNQRRGASSVLINEIWSLYKQGKMVDAADKRLKANFDGKEMECLMNVGLLCTNPTARERPSARQVIQYLNFEATLPILPAMMHDPVFPYNSELEGRNTR